MQERHGLTLAEVVVVIIVLVALIGFLLPMHNRHHESPNRTICLNNLKQIGTGLALYSSDTYYGTMPPLGPRTLLFDNGNGILGDERVFLCPDVEEGGHHPMGDYARCIYWDASKKPNVVIAGDYGGLANHNDEVAVLLFKDGHTKISRTIADVEGAYDSTDNIYDDVGDPIVSTTRSCLTARD